MSFRIQSVIARLPHVASVSMPSAVRRHHQLTGPCAFGHPSTEIFSKYFSDLQTLCRTSEGLLRSWILKAEDPTVTTTSVFARFMDSLSRDPYFAKAAMAVPERYKRSSEALFRYLCEVQDARALMILAGYSELFNPSPFVDRSDPIDMLPSSVQEKIRRGRLTILNQANCLRDWIGDHAHEIAEMGTCSITYSDPALPIGVVPAEVTSWQLMYVELNEQQITRFPGLDLTLIKYLSLQDNPIGVIPEDLNKLPHTARVHLSEQNIEQIDADLKHPALSGCKGLQSAARRLYLC